MDFRGHGRSARDVSDFGLAQLTEDAIAVIEHSKSSTVVPVALSHAGWVAVELRKRLGDRIAKMILLDWIVLDPPAPFLQALTALQAEESWKPVRDQLFAMWLGGTNNEQVSEFLASDMGEYSGDVWARAGREIAKSYLAHESPLKALAALPSPAPVLHIYAQPDDPAYLEMQQSLAARYWWFHVVKLHAKTHFPMFEVPSAVIDAITSFVASEPQGAG
jgi:pimeloyl-ACP methyl ester carboxylesterase